MQEVWATRAGVVKGVGGDKNARLKRMGVQAWVFGGMERLACDIWAWVRAGVPLRRREGMACVGLAGVVRISKGVVRACLAVRKRGGKKGVRRYGRGWTMRA